MSLITMDMDIESENDSEYDEWVVDDINYVQEAQQMVCNYSQISIENALILNKQMRSYLNDLKHELERMLSVCQEKYKQNDVRLADMSKIKPTPKIYTTYYFCGYPFFKDRMGGAPPKSAEYLRRSETDGELFPLDLEKRALWLPRDKVELVQGVKKQTIAYLQSMHRNRIRQAAGKRCASELTARIQNESDALENMHLSELFKKTEGSDFRINWFNVSMDALQDRHSANECMAMWNAYLMPTLNRKSWTPAEEDKLLNAAIKYDAQNWPEIAKAVENRSVYQCLVHYQTQFNVKSVQKNVRWTTDEDQQLMACVDKFRIGNIIPWTKVMESCPGRSKLQLYNRYMFSLNPEINRAPFTVEEDCILMAAIKEYGLNYREFPTNLLPGRSMKQIRSRYNNVLKHVNVREHWTEQHDQKLMQLVEQHGTTEWAKIAEQMINHSRTSCRQRYTTIKRFLDKHPGKTVLDVPRRKRAFSTNVTTDNWMKTIIEAKHFDSIESAESMEFQVNTGPQNNEKPNNKTQLYNTPYWDLLKYSYNFKFGTAIAGSDALFENVQIACQLLQAPSLPARIDVTDKWFSGFVQMEKQAKKIQLESDLLRSLIQLGKNDFFYPVNFNTVLGMRGLTIMFETVDKRKSSAKAIKAEPNAIEEHDALNLFKMRFKSIFKHTAAVSQLQRSLTSVSLRLRNQKRSLMEMQMVTPLNPDVDTNTADQHLVGVQTEPKITTICESEELTMSESECQPRKRCRVTVLESIPVNIIDQNAIDPLSQASTSTEIKYNRYRYRVETSDSIHETKIQPYYSESETEGTVGDETDFVIWTPTLTDEATGSTTIKPEKK